MSVAARFRSYGEASLRQAREILSRPRQRPLSPSTVRRYAGGTMARARFWFTAAARVTLIDKKIALRSS